MEAAKTNEDPVVPKYAFNPPTPLFESIFPRRWGKRGKEDGEDKVGMKEG